MKKLLLSLVGILCAMSMWADEVILATSTMDAQAKGAVGPVGTSTAANNVMIGKSDGIGTGWILQCNNLGKGCNGSGTLNIGGTNYTPLKNSNGAKHTVKLPDGYKATSVTFYAASNYTIGSDNGSGGTYGTPKLSEINGTSCSDNVVDKGSTPNPITKSLDKVNSFTFTFSTTQVIYCIKVTYTIPSDNTPSFTTDLNAAYNTDTKTTLPLSVVATDKTELKWYEASSTTADPANDTELGTGDSYNFKKTIAGTYYVYCRAYNENATGEKYAYSTVATISVASAALNTETEVKNLILDNGCNTAIVDGTKTITGYYMQGAATPGVKSITLSDGATYAINGNTLTVTAEDGTTTQDYTYTLTAVEPLTDVTEQQIGTSTTWIKMGNSWQDGKSSYEILKNENTVGGTQRITEGLNRAYIFVGPCDAVVITNTSSKMSSDRANSTYAVNGAAAVTVTLPKSTGSITIPCNPSQNNMIEIVNKGTGSWGFDKVDMVTKAEYDVNNTLFYGKAKSGVTLTVTNAVKTADITSEYADITGGTMQAYNGHASNDAAMVVNGQFNLNASGACYFYVHLDNALKVGDVIYSENGDNLLVTEYIVETTSNKGSDKYLFPYEVTAGSNLDGATELYIWKTTVGTFTGIKVVGDKVIATTTVNGAENAFATYCGSQNFTATAGTIFKGAVSSNAVALTCVNPNGDEIIPASAGVIISTTGDGSVTISNTTASATANMNGNELQGTTSRIETPVNCMALNATAGEFQSYTGAYFPANKAYLVNAAGAKNMRVVFGNTTGIKAVNAEKVANAKFIENGRIVIVKDGAKYNVAGQVIK